MTRKNFGLYAMALLYMLAGLNHFLRPQFYTAIMPPWVPYRTAAIFFTGLWEIAGGLLLLFLRTRRIAAWSLIALLVAVFPANVQMAINWQQAGHPGVWLAYARLPLQALLVWWAWRYTRSVPAAASVK